MLSTLTHTIIRLRHKKHLKKDEGFKWYDPEWASKCRPITDQLVKAAINHVGADVIKGLTLVDQLEYVQACQRIDIPYGLFGFSMEKFLERIKQNTVHIDVLMLVAEDALEQAKLCIVLDDLKDYIERLIRGFLNGDTEAVLHDIDGAMELLNISDFMHEECKTHQEKLAKLLEAERAYDFHRQKENFTWNCKLWDLQNEIIERQMLVDPIEYRYRIKYHKFDIEAFQFKLESAEERAQSKLDDVNNIRNRETLVHGYVKIKQRKDTEYLRSQINELTDKFNRDYEFYDGRVSYYTTSLETLVMEQKDNQAMMGIYQNEIEKLKQWFLKKKTRRVHKKVKKGSKKTQAAKTKSARKVK